MMASGGTRGDARTPSMREVLGIAREQPGYVRLAELPPRAVRIIVASGSPMPLDWASGFTDELSEDELAELNLNCVELGRDVFGLGQGARALFGRRAADLTDNQAVLIAAIIPNPHLRRPTKTPTYCEGFRNEMLELLVKRGVLEAREAREIAQRHTAEAGLDPDLVPERERPADPYRGKDAGGLVEFARSQLGAAYWWGTYGQVATPGLLVRQVSKYPERLDAARCLADLGARVFDCSGLIKGYLWSDDALEPPLFDRRTDLSAAMLFANAPERGDVDAFPRAHGSLLFRGREPGAITHVGVYADEGEGCVYHAKSPLEGVVREPYRTSEWSLWGTLPLEDA